MTATWSLESTNPQTPVCLHFYAGPSGLRPNYETYTVHLNAQTRDFNNQIAADEYALSLGVTEWRFVESNRAFPFAANIPIRFADSPDDSELLELIARFERGESLTQLTTELTNNDHPVSPGMLRIWMLGCQPNNKSLAGLRPKRRDER